MARIRSIKPEFWTDEKVVELSITSRLLFIGLWNFADEHGNLDGSAKRIKMQIFPADSLDVESCLLEIRQVGLISDYFVEGKRYFHINGFHKHQKLNSTSSNKFPPPEMADEEKLADESDKNALVLVLGKVKDSSSAKKFSDQDRRIAEHIRSMIRDMNPKSKEPNLDHWANEIRLMRERDSRTHDEIVSLFTWAHNDTFWRTNILSPDKLRMKWDQLAVKCGATLTQQYGEGSL